MTLLKNSIRPERLCLLAVMVINSAFIYLLFCNFNNEQPVSISKVFETFYGTAKLDFVALFYTTIYPLLLLLMCLAILILVKADSKDKYMFALPGIFTILVLIIGIFVWRQGLLELFSIPFLMWPLYYGLKKSENVPEGSKIKQ